VGFTAIPLPVGIGLGPIRVGVLQPVVTRAAEVLERHGPGVADEHLLVPIEELGGPRVPRRAQLHHVLLVQVTGQPRRLGRRHHPRRTPEPDPAVRLGQRLTAASGQQRGTGRRARRRPLLLGVPLAGRAGANRLELRDPPIQVHDRRGVGQRGGIHPDQLVDRCRQQLHPSIMTRGCDSETGRTGHR
jgi:hypothetical protein